MPKKISYDEFNAMLENPDVPDATILEPTTSTAQKQG